MEIAEITARTQSRQPECSATTPPVIVSNETRRRPAARIISAKTFGFGNLRIELDQIAIGLGVARHGAADRGNDVERIELVEPIETRHVDRGKFQAEEMPAGLQHAMDLAERHVDARHVADAERDGDGIEALVRERQRLGVGLDEFDIALGLRGALAADREHVGVDVGDRDMGAGAGLVGDAEGHVAGAAGQIEQRERRRRFLAD